MSKDDNIWPKNKLGSQASPPNQLPGSQTSPFPLSQLSGSQTFPTLPIPPLRSGHQGNAHQDTWLPASTLKNQTLLQQSSPHLVTLPSTLPWSSPPRHSAPPPLATLPSPFQWPSPSPTTECTWGTLPALVTSCPTCCAWGLLTPN